MKRMMFFSLLLSCGLAGSGYCDPESMTNPDSSQVKAQDAGSDEGELVLEAIEIRGRVERPGVIILPKRMTPHIKEVEINRSFEEEVKNGVGDLPQPDQVLRRLEPVNNIKKAVEKERQ
ncbi:MAG TPA: hypothetical protein ENN17_08890 [bacterium]|nr:hypothetical protein [bacterium]